jgi:LysR family transcriptional activator of nhaA
MALIERIKRIAENISLNNQKIMLLLFEFLELGGALMEWLNYHHLLYFWTIMHEGSLTAASKRLLLAPSTVSSQVGRLEEALGGKLFRRVGRGLEPTDLGQTVFQYADKIFSLGREMMDTVRGRPVVGPLSLKVGVSAMVPKLIVRKILEPVFSLPEQVHLVCHEDKEEALLSELALHRLDVVLNDSPVGRGMHIKAYNHLLGECGVTFLGVQRLAEEYRAGFPKSLDRAPMLVPLERNTFRQWLERWFESLDIRPVIVAEFQDSALMKAFGEHGDGIFAAPSVVEKEVQCQYNVEVVGRTDWIRESFYALSLERIVKHPAVTAITSVARKSLFVKNKDTR